MQCRPCKEKGSGQLSVEDQTPDSPRGFVMLWGAACCSMDSHFETSAGRPSSDALPLLSREEDAAHPHLGVINEKNGPHRVTADS